LKLDEKCMLKLYTELDENGWKVYIKLNFKLDEKLNDYHTIWDCIYENNVDYILPIYIKYIVCLSNLNNS